MANNKEATCPIAATLGYIGGRWKAAILYHLAAGTRRFGEIAVRMPPISKKVLTQQLKELERDGLVRRVQNPGAPMRVEYSLTDLGKSLSTVLKEMSDWGKANVLTKE